MGFASEIRQPITTGMDTDQDSASNQPPSDKAWEEMAKNILRGEMMRLGVSYAKLPELLAKQGVIDNELNLRNKVGRGRFTAVFFLQVLKALDVDWLKIPTSLEEASKKGGAQVLARKVQKPGADA